MLARAARRDPARPCAGASSSRAGWPHGAIVRENTLDAYVARLRRKLKQLERGAGDRDRPRRRLPDRMSRLGLRRRLLLVVGRDGRARPSRGSSRASTSCSRARSTATRATSCARAPSRRSLASRRPRAAIVRRAARRPLRRRLSSGCSRGERVLERRACPRRCRARGARPRRRTVRASPMSPQTDTRLYAAPVVAGGKRVGTVVAGVSLAPYEETRTTALVASLIFGGLVLAARRRSSAGGCSAPRCGRSCG